MLCGCKIVGTSMNWEVDCVINDFLVPKVEVGKIELKSMIDFCGQNLTRYYKK